MKNNTNNSTNTTPNYNLIERKVICYMCSRRSDMHTSMADECMEGWLKLSAHSLATSHDYSDFIDKQGFLYRCPSCLKGKTYPIRSNFNDLGLRKRRKKD